MAQLFRHWTLKSATQDRSPHSPLLVAAVARVHLSGSFLPKLKVAQARGLGFQKGGGGVMQLSNMYKQLGRAGTFKAQWFRLWTRRPGIDPRTLHLHRCLCHYCLCGIQWNKHWCRHIILFFIIRCLSTVPRINSRGISQGLLHHNIIVKVAHI